MPTFTPPTKTLKWRHRSPYEAGVPFDRLDIGVAVVKLQDGTWAEYTVLPDQVRKTAQRIYLGGHIHTLTTEEADELTAAGYTVVHTPYGSGAYGSGQYGG